MAVTAGCAFVTEGSPAEAFFTVISGTAKLFKLLPDGRRLITGFAARGHFLGLAVAAQYAFGAEAVDAMQVCRYSRDNLKRLLVEFPAMETRLLEVTTNELVAAQEQMLLLGRKSARERLASFLVADARERGQGQTASATVALPMTRGDIGDYLGLTLETVSRSFAQLAREGLIALPSPSRVVIVKEAVLRQIATGLLRSRPPPACGQRA